MKFVILLMLSFSINVYGLVKYDEGRLNINGIQLLQDKDDAKLYYYLPQFPRIAVKNDNSFEFLCVKYVSKTNENNGGIFHALIEFNLSPATVQWLETELRKKVAGGKIAGPVPMQQALKDGEEGLANISVVSAIMSEGENNKFLKGKVITSSQAPLLPGSKAAIAVNLSPEGVTLLWESLKGNTSDISVSIQGYYEAYVQGYNATIKADISTIYSHFSKIQAQQNGFDKTQIRKIVDDLRQNQSIKIEVFDRSDGLGIKAESMQKIVDLVTEKLTTILFDSQHGWSVTPEKERINEKSLPGRQERGWFSRTFGGSENTPYYSDNQFVLKDIKDIRSQQFYLNLSKSTTIRVPIFTSGNIGGLYQQMNKDNPNQYFKIVNLDDADFQKREIGFQMDGSYAESFAELLNTVSVTFKKKYPNGENDVTEDVLIRKSDIEKGTDYKIIKYPRLGIKESSWLDYEYKVNWSLKGNNTLIKQPEKDNDWLKANSSSIVLVPPFNKRVIEVEVDKNTMKEQEVTTANIRFFVILNHVPQAQKSILFKQDDVATGLKLALYHDSSEPAAYQVSWYGKNGKVEEPLKELKNGENYLNLNVPAKTEFIR